jgi:sec-independent protein translocase protein TatA
MTPVLGEIIGWEFLLVLAIVALLFGSSQLPKLARSMGQASKEFKKGIDDGLDDDDAPKADDTEKPNTEKPNTEKPKSE